MITHTGLGHVYHIKDGSRTPTLVVTRTPYYAHLLDKLDIALHKFAHRTRPTEWLLRRAWCTRGTDTLRGWGCVPFELWVFEKAQRYSIPITDEQRDEFQRTFGHGRDEQRTNINCES